MMTAVERAREAWGMDHLPADNARHDRLMTAIRRVEPVRHVAAVTPRDPFRWRNEYHRLLQTENAALRARIVSIRRARQIGGARDREEFRRRLNELIEDGQVVAEQMNRERDDASRWSK